MTTTAPRPVTPADAPAPASLFALGGEALALQAEITALAERLDPDLGDEFDPEIVAALEALLLAEEGNREALYRKADAYCWVIGRLQAQAAYRRAESDRLRDLADDDSRRADALRDKLIDVLSRLQPDDTSFSLPAHELRSRRTESVVIDPDLDLADLPPELLRERRTVQPDKAAIKAALRAGRAVPGAELVQGRSWSIC